MEDTKTSATKTIGTRKRVLTVAVFIVAGLVLLAGIAAAVFLGVGKNSLVHPEGYVTDSMKVYSGAQSSDSGRTVIYNGKTYERNEDVVPICVMGSDRGLHGAKVDAYNVNGQADAIMVLAVNTSNNDINLISIPRDIVIESTEEYRESRKNEGYDASTMGLYMAYAYADNAEQGSEIMISHVSDILFGLPIYHYCTFNIGAVADIADLVDGVTLEALYTIPPTSYSSDMPIEAGETVTLHGSDALRYIQYRDIMRTGTALERLERQRQFVTICGKDLVEKLKRDPGTVFRIQDILQENATTNLGIAEIAYLCSVAVKANMDNVDTTRLTGETFYHETSSSRIALTRLDEASTYQTVLDAFYTRAD